MRVTYRIRGALALVLALGGSALPARAQENAAADTLRLTLDDARRIALESSPEYRAEVERIAAERGALRQARLLDNPEAEFEAPDAITGGGVDRYETGVSQEIEWAGQRGLRIDAAELGVRRARAEVERSARLLLADVTRAWLAAAAALRRSEAASEVLVLNERLARAVAVREASGEISTMDANLARIEVARARAELLETRRAAVSAELELRRLLGIEPQVAVTVDTTDGTLAEYAPVLPTDTAAGDVAAAVDSLVALALERRADLVAIRATQAQVEALARLARREAIPPLRVGAVTERDGVDEPTRFGVSVGLPIPLWNRNQGLIETREAEARRAEALARALEIRVRTEVADAVNRYLSAAAEAELLEREVLEPARETQRMLTIAYEAGRIDLPALVLTRGELLDAEMAYWDAWVALHVAHAELDAATGAPLPQYHHTDESHHDR